MYQCCVIFALPVFQAVFLFLTDRWRLRTRAPRA